MHGDFHTPYTSLAACCASAPFSPSLTLIGFPLKKTFALLRLLPTLGIMLLPVASHAAYGDPASAFNNLQTPEIVATRPQAIADLQRLMSQQDTFLAPEHGKDRALATFEEAQQAAMRQGW